MIRLRPCAAVLILVALSVLAGCSTTGHKRGGYYKDDGPEANPPADVQDIPDAVPRIETHNPANGKPYTVFGKHYVPVGDESEFEQKGIASWYGKKFHGGQTANGETYDMYGMTAAHPTLPIPSYAKVTRVSTGKSVIVRINDRGPFHSSRIIDLSYAAAAKLGIIKDGSAQVIVQAITNNDIRHNTVQTAKVEPESHPAIVADSAPAAPAVHPPESAPAAPADATQADPPADADAHRIYLQFGAFGAAKNADRLASRLNQHITQIESRRALVETADNLHRVQIGPYPSRTAAVNAALRIQEATGMQPTIAVR